MAYRALGVVVVSALLVGGSVWLDAQSGRSVVEGAWEVQDVTFAKLTSAKPNKPMGLVLFTGNHYSQTYLRDSSPRPEVGPLGEDAKTIDQLRAAWGPLTSNAGTFEVSGNTLTTRGTVAKGNPPMAKGAFTENTFTLKGDALVLISTRDLAGPAANPRTLRLTRAK